MVGDVKRREHAPHASHDERTSTDSRSSNGSATRPPPRNCTGRAQAREDAKLKAEAFAGGANDYLVKFPDRAELVARSGTTQKASSTCSNATRRMPRSPRELADAAAYVRSLLLGHCADGSGPIGRWSPARAGRRFIRLSLDRRPSLRIYFWMSAAAASARPCTRRASFRQSGIMACTRPPTFSIPVRCCGR